MQQSPIIRNSLIPRHYIYYRPLPRFTGTDGPYSIEILEVSDEGKLIARYFNPGPIHVGRSGWRIKDDKLQVYVELQDENYPGSLYELNYNEDEDQLEGLYYQAVSKQTYHVVFNKN